MEEEPTTTPGRGRRLVGATGRGVKRAGSATGRRRVVHLPPGAPRLERRGRGRLRALPPHRAARVQRRGRRRRGDLAGRHPVLRPARRGAGPGGAVPRPDDAAVRGRGAAARALPRPVQPRTPMGDRLHDGAARLPVLADGRRRGDAVDRDVPDGARRPRLLQGVRRGPCRHGAAPAAAGPHPGQGEQPDLARRRGRGRDLRADRRRWPRRSGPQWSLRYAFVVFAGATILSILLPARPTRTGDELPVSLRGEQAKFRVPARRGVRAALQRRAADAVGLPDHVHGLPAAPAPAPRLGAPRPPC